MNLRNHPTDPSPSRPQWPHETIHETEIMTAYDPAFRAKNVVAIDRMEFTHVCDRSVQQKDLSEHVSYETYASQTSDYDYENKAAPNNNLFFEKRSNPLSSKGN